MPTKKLKPNPIDKRSTKFKKKWHKDMMSAYNKAKKRDKGKRL